MVQTDDVTYHCTWADVAELLEHDDGAIASSIVDGAARRPSSTTATSSGRCASSDD